MAHFAQIDENNVVLRVIVVNNEDVGNLEFPESEPVGLAFLNNLYGEGLIWKQTSYNHNFRKGYAIIGGTYNQELDAFVNPKEYPSWVLNTELARYEPPIPFPTDGNNYYWDESQLNWVNES
jgi:hypothetical protein